MNETKILSEVQDLFNQLTGVSTEMNTINSVETISTSHILLTILQLVKDMENNQGQQKLIFNFDPPGSLWSDKLRIDNDEDVKQYAIVFGILSE